MPEQRIRYLIIICDLHPATAEQLLSGQTPRPLSEGVKLLLEQRQVILAAEQHRLETHILRVRTALNLKDWGAAERAIEGLQSWLGSEDAETAEDMRREYERARAGKERAEKAAALTLVFEWVSIPPTSFSMGGGPGSKIKPKPVVLTKAVEIAKFEVTQDQWQQVMGANPSFYKGNRRPVENVSWIEAQDFLVLLNTRGDGYRYRLPTEAEWEFAARQDNSSMDHWSREKYAHTGIVTFTNVVGASHPTSRGIFDLYGNVSEWCLDWYAVYDSTPETNPQGPTTGHYRVIRGGNWGNNPRNAVLQEARESSLLAFYFEYRPRETDKVRFDLFRDAASPDHRSPRLGFRLARERLE